MPIDPNSAHDDPPCAATPVTIEAWLRGWGELWSVPQIAGATITRSGRMRRCLGRCFPRRGEIRLNQHLFEGPVGFLREILCHEAAHLAVYLLEGETARPHGAEWKRLMRLAGYRPQARIPIDRLPRAIAEAAQPQHGYLHTCRTCGASRRALRRMNRWRCATCRRQGRRGELSIERVSLKPAALQSALP